MQTVPEFFQGSIAQDFQAILDADLLREASSGELACKAKGPPRSPAPQCTSPVRCNKSAPKCSNNKACTSRNDKCKPPKKKAAAFLPGVEGWSIPPAPPAF